VGSRGEIPFAARRPRGDESRMALQDRDYLRDESAGGFGRGLGAGFGGGRFRLSVNGWIIAINLAVFLLGMFVPGLGAKLTDLGHFSTYMLVKKLEFWRVITFQFLHAGPAHVFFNMFGLYMFGSIVEQHLGGRRYAAFYLVSGVCGGLMYFILNAIAQVFASFQWPQIPGLLFTSPTTPLVGASAGVFGVIMACAYIAPNAVVQLILPPVPIRLKLLAYGYVGIALFNVLLGGQNQGGDAAHIGGAVAGYFFIRHSHLLSDFFDVFGPKSDRGKKRNSKFPKFGAGQREGGGLSAGTVSEVDRILAKVRDQGLASLSEREKTTLREATEAQRRA